MKMKNEYQYQSHENIPTSLQGGWESVSGNPDVYILQGYDGNYCLLAYFYDKECERGSFSCHEIYLDENGYYIGVGTKHYRLSEEQSPYGLHIGDWGSYMRN